MTSALGTLRSKGHVITLMHFMFITLINKQLQKARNAIVFSITLFGDLFLVIFVDNFY